MSIAPIPIVLGGGGGGGGGEIHLENRLNMQNLRAVHAQGMAAQADAFAGALPMPGGISRSQAVATSLFNEKDGIVAYFRDLYPMTRRAIESWIINTPEMSSESIREDLEKIKQFFLSCNDLFVSEDDKAVVTEAMKLFFRERFVWMLDTSTSQLRSVLATL
jgi:hypothetical protein